MNTNPNIIKLERVLKLVDWYERGLIPKLARHEVNPELAPGSRESYLYFTLPVCINFQRNSPALWSAALATWNDQETRYVFFPEQLAEHSPEQVRVSLTKHKLALQPNRHVLIWTTIARSFQEFYHSDPRELIAEADFDAGQLLRLLQVVYRKRFPYLSGPKLANYWPYILSQHTDVRFSNAHEISIIPDTHVIQSSVRLGLVPAGASSRQVEAAWRELLMGSGIMPSEVHPVLWHWSRNRFVPWPD